MIYVKFHCHLRVDALSSLSTVNCRGDVKMYGCGNALCVRGCVNVLGQV